MPKALPQICPCVLSKATRMSDFLKRFSGIDTSVTSRVKRTKYSAFEQTRVTTFFFHAVQPFPVTKLLRKTFCYERIRQSR